MIGLIDVDGNNSIRMVSLDGDSLIVYPKRTVACEDSIPAPIPFQYEGTDQFYAYPIHCIDDDKWSYVIISDEGRNNLETWLVEDYCHPFHIGAAAVLRGFIEAIDIEKIRTLRYSVPELNSFWIPGQLEDRHTQGNVGFTLSPPQTFDVALFPQKGLTFEGCLTPRIIKDEEELLAIRLQSQLELTLATPISLDVLFSVYRGVVQTFWFLSRRRSVDSNHMLCEVYSEQSYMTYEISMQVNFADFDQGGPFSNIGPDMIGFDCVKSHFGELVSFFIANPSLPWIHLPKNASRLFSLDPEESARIVGAFEYTSKLLKNKGKSPSLSSPGEVVVKCLTELSDVSICKSRDKKEFKYYLDTVQRTVAHESAYRCIQRTIRCLESIHPLIEKIYGQNGDIKDIYTKIAAWATGLRNPSAHGEERVTATWQSVGSILVVQSAWYAMILEHVGYNVRETEKIIDRMFFLAAACLDKDASES